MGVLRDPTITRATGDSPFFLSRVPPVCIVGPNGVGKSTLLQLLTGQLTPVGSPPSPKNWGGTPPKRWGVCLSLGTLLWFLGLPPGSPQWGETL